MAAILLPSSSVLKLLRPNPAFRSSSPQRAARLFLNTPPRASAEEESITEQDDSFENRLSKVRLRYPSRTEERAEIKKSKKAKKSGSGSSVLLPPVPLKEPISSDGLPVEFGFSPYSELLNGRIALLGLTALLAVEMATGKGVLNYHSPAIALLQVYFVAAVSALYIKYQKESNSVWPDTKP